MIRTCVDPALHALSKVQAFWDSLSSVSLIENEPLSWIENVIDDIAGYRVEWQAPDGKVYRRKVLWEAYHVKVQAWSREVRFLKMGLSCFVTCDVSDPEIWITLSCMLAAIEAMWEEFEDCIADSILGKPVSGIEDWDQLASSLDGRIQQCKPLIEENCHVLLDSSLRCKSLTSDESVEFLDCIRTNLKYLFSHKADKISPLKKQIGILQEQIELVFDFYVLIAHGCIDSKELRDFKACLLNFANNAACLTFLFWAQADANEEIMFTSKLNLIIADMRPKIIRPCAPDDTALYLAAFKSIRLQGSHNTLVLGRVVAGFVDLHLENLVAVSKDDFQELRDGLIFLLTFLADPPQVLEGLIILLLMADPPEECEMDYELTLILNQADALLFEGSSLLLSLEVMKADFAKQKMLLCDFVGKIEIIKGKIRQLYVGIPVSSSYNFPKTNGLGKFDIVLQNLKSLKEKLKSDTKLIPFGKNFIIKIEEELVRLRPSLSDIFELQKEHKEFKDAWPQVISLAYQTELFINTCCVDLHPAWYNMARLFNILENIRIVKSMLEKVKIGMMYNRDSLPSISMSSEISHYAIINEEVVGFVKETEKITEELIRGYKHVAIISIVGMGGVGKTTLAKKIYNAKSVRHHFHKLSFCFVSQVYNTRNLLLDILRCLITVNDEIRSMTKDDLAHQLWKCLSGQRYLIVMDDIWDITAWEEVKHSLPDDKNGSRVIFTTRWAKVAQKATSSLHRLNLLSEDESLMLLQRKAFGKDGCPPIFSEFGKLIAKNCRGLPLAIVLVGGLLAKTEKSKTWWNEIVETTRSYVFYEGCEDIIELSYMHLPEHLKACFLYFGIFNEDGFIKGKRLELLWIAEGFVNKHVNKSYRSVAKEYLSDLVDRNLVIVVRRTSRGAIKTCRLHDLIRDFCQKRAQEDNFLQLTNGYAHSNSSNSKICYRYCVCGEMDKRSFNNVEPLAATIHSLVDRRKRSRSDAITDKFGFICRNLKLVHVLHLEDLGMVLFPTKFQLVDLVHLKYIFVSRIQIVSVPESIYNLWNLETFIWKSIGRTMKFPKTIWKMKRLRHLEGSKWELVLGDDKHEGGCRLDSMESFSMLVLHDERTTSELLQRFPNIQKLRIYIHLFDPTFILKLNFLTKLESLELHNVKIVSVIFPSSLKRLSIKSCFCIPLDLIGELPYLEVLKIQWWKRKWERWEVEDDKFSKLKYLNLSYCEFKHWDASPNSFPCLEQLVLKDCSLEEIPACFGELPTLQRIQVDCCSDTLKNSAIQIQKEQMEYGNDVQLNFQKYS